MRPERPCLTLERSFPLRGGAVQSRREATLIEAECDGDWREAGAPKTATTVRLGRR